MARLPAISRLVIEDFPSEKSWIGKLIQPLNTFMTEIIQGLNRGLTFSENMFSQIITVKAIGAASFAPVYFKSTIGRPIGIVVLKYVDAANTPTTNTTAIGLDWSYDFATELVTLNAVPGLVNGITYNITLLSIGG